MRRHHSHDSMASAIAVVILVFAIVMFAAYLVG